jgi:DNA-directed RNA polymerase specialized sigma24 family protein
MLISSEFKSQQEREMRSAINRFPKRQREVIFLKFDEGLSNDENRKGHGNQRQTVSNFIYKAISQLKNDLPSFSIVIPQIISIFFIKYLS